MLRTIRSEWIKLTTTKAFWWTSALIVLVSLGMAALFGYTTGLTLNNPQFREDPQFVMAMRETLKFPAAVSGFDLFGIMIVLIQSVLLVASEYSTGTSKTTVLATPKRWPVPVAKLLVYGIYSVVLTFVVLIACVYVLRFTAAINIDDASFLSDLSLGADDAWVRLARYCLYSFLCVMLAIGVTYVVRNTAGAVALILLWKLIVEMAIIPFVPWVRDHLPQYMPFANANAALNLQNLDDAPWGQMGSLLYFGLWALVLFGLGVVALTRRDA